MNSDKSQQKEPEFTTFISKCVVAQIYKASKLTFYIINRNQD